MEDQQRAQLEEAIQGNQAKGSRKLKHLYDQHAKLDQKVSEFVSRGFLTSSEEIELKKLKVKKLSGMDSMMRILNAD